jgi:hypothetical protein
MGPWEGAWGEADRGGESSKLGIPAFGSSRVTVFFILQLGQTKVKGLPTGRLALGGIFNFFWQ